MRISRRAAALATARVMVAQAELDEENGNDSGAACSWLLAADDFAEAGRFDEAAQCEKAAAVNFANAYGHPVSLARMREMVHQEERGE
jgi:hypothetical protein